MTESIDSTHPVGSPSDGARHGFLVVGLGGSAGSIPSFREFFRNVPPDSGMAYVVILHLSPEHESRLPDILQAAASIPVMQVQETIKIEPDHVYVISPNKSLAMDDGMLVPSDPKGFEERRAPVDIFFRTLAVNHGARAICVVVSGSGSDGSAGLRRIKEHNGLVIVQDPSEAQFGEMPRSSIATGMADFILPVAEMPQRIFAYRDQLQALEMPDTGTEAEVSEHDEQALVDIFTTLRVRTGHDFANYKRATVLRRIERRLALYGLVRLSDYARYMRDHAEEPAALLRELLISVTNFFRDRHVWDYVEEKIIPRLLSGRRNGDAVRIWVAGCASGEEAYSVAMLIAERLTPMPSPPEVLIFATDLDERAISRARNAVYNEAEVADVPPERLARFFVRETDGYRVRREIREMILFAHHNLIKDPPFSHVDFISCRNLLIYLNRTAQQRAMEVLHFALEPGRFLLLGTAEAVEAATNLFSVVDKEAHVYESRAVQRVIKVLPAARGPAVRAGPRAAAESRPPEDPVSERLMPIDLHHRLLEQYAAPSVIIDEQHNIVHLSEHAGKYLHFPPGELSQNLLQVIPPEMRLEIRSALLQAGQKRTGVVVRTEKVVVTVRPALGDSDPARGFFLVLFEDAREAHEASATQTAAAFDPETRQLEDELFRSRAQMRSTVEQYEVQAEEAKAANEELQAMNEELRSTAEELETSQEELQSLNEELQTVNQELKIKIEEIGHTNDDLRNLMTSTDIGTIFVDRSLRVKLFTPRVRDIFNLIPADVGRPLLDITNKLTTSDLGANLQRVLDRLQTLEQEVTTRDGAWYLMRLLPYRTAEDRIDGVVLTLVDITERRKSEANLRAVANIVPDLLWSTDRHGAIDWSNRRWLEYTGQTADEAIRTGWASVHPEDREMSRTKFDEAMRSGQPVRLEHRMKNSEGRYRWFLVQAEPLRDEQGQVIRWFGAATDIHEDRMARESLEQRMKERTHELQEVSAQRQELLERLVNATEEERRRIARELHDEMGQHITALKMGLEALKNEGEPVARMKGLVTRLDQTVDRLTLELRPPVLDDLGLAGAIGSLADQFSASSGIHADVHASRLGKRRLGEEIETTLYRVVQEALTNVWKHSSAKQVSVILEEQNGQVQLTIDDDGLGFVAGDEKEGYGLIGIRERVSLIRGTFHVESHSDRGTTLYVRVPLPGRAGR